MIIDSHQHFWHYNPKRDKWIDDSMGILKKDFLPDDLESLVQKNRVKGCISVQAAQSEEETEFLIGLANKYTFIKAVVGWVDLRSPNVEDRIKYFTQFKKLKGFRHILQAEAEDFMLKKDFRNGLGFLNNYNFTFDLLIVQSQLPEAVELVKEFPNQRFVLDHLAKPDFKTGNFQFWKKHISMLAQSKNVFCKLSGLVTEANWGEWSEQEFYPYLDVAFESFGSNRLMYGSDWPVCLLSADYNEVMNVVLNYMQGWPASETEKIMATNALEFYDIQ